MLLSRRSLAKGAIATLFVASGQADRASGQASPPRQVPTPDDLLSGDLLWPKKPNAYVPYNAGSDADYERERKQWDSEKRRFIDNVRQKADAPRELRELANQLEVMEFREFLARYEDDERPGVPDTYGGGLPLYVGQMAIVFMDGRVPSVVEALYGKGVVTSTYE